MSEMKNGITKGTFIIGILLAVLASSLVSTLISMQYSFGPKGEQGIAGQNGLNGVQGIQGIRGEQGLPGVQGEQGIQGLKGDTGPQGPEGNVSLANIAGWLPSPAYDSGWTLITTSGNYRFTHGLNTTELVVYMLSKEANGYIDQKSESAAWWRIISPNEIEAWRSQSTNPFLVRVLAWKIV